MTTVYIIQSSQWGTIPNKTRVFATREAADAAWTNIATELLGLDRLWHDEDGKPYWLNDWCEVTYLQDKPRNPSDVFYRLAVEVEGS